MERKRESSVMMWALVAAMLSQNLVILPVMCNSSFEDQKNFYYYSPDPHTGTPPSGWHGTPPSHSGSYGTPPSHSGGGHGGGLPPTNCGGSPPSGGHHHTTPTLTPPSSSSSGHGHGGGYTYTPPIISGGSPPVTFTPPISPIVIPGISTPPSPPFVLDPNSPPFSCNYWRTHPTLIWGLFGLAGTTMGGAFGLPSIPTTPGISSTTTLQQSLKNVRTDGYGALYREASAALLNSMVDHKFPFTTSQVRDSFVSATKSNKAASAQARVFRLANEGRLQN